MIRQTMKAKNMPSVGIIIHPYYWDWENYPYRGIDRYNSEVINGLKKLNIFVEIYDSGYVHAHGEGFIKELLFPFKLFTKKADCFLGTHAMGSKWAIFLGKRPLVTVIQDLLPFAYGEGQYDWAFKYAIKRLSIRLAIYGSDRLIVGYPSTKKEIVAKFGINPEKIAVIPYGIDHSKFFPEADKKLQSQKILFVGEAARAKGVDSLLIAFKKLLSRAPNKQLIIASEGRDLKFLQNMARDLNIAKETEFLGRVSEVALPDLYRSADIFVFPSRHGFGLPILEAMACGIPVIAGRIFDTIDFVGDAGVLVNPENTDELADAMFGLLADNFLWKAYREKGIARAGQFSWEKTVEKILFLCEFERKHYSGI